APKPSCAPVPDAWPPWGPAALLCRWNHSCQQAYFAPGPGTAGARNSPPARSTVVNPLLARSCPGGHLARVGCDPVSGQEARMMEDEDDDEENRRDRGGVRDARGVGGGDGGPGECGGAPRAGGDRDRPRPCELRQLRVLRDHEHH